MRPLLARIGTALAVLVPATVLAGAVPAGAAVQGQPGQLVVHSSTFDLNSTADPQPLTVSCLPDEQLVSGGYLASTPDAHIAFSYPSDATGAVTPDGARPAAWTVGAVNDTKTVPTVQVSAVCLTGGDSQASVASATEEHAEQTFTVGAQCPDGTVRSGGGFRSIWDRRDGTAAVTGSYPQSDGRWSVDAALLPGDPDIKARASLTVFAVCQSGGIAGADLTPTTFSLDSAPPVCTGGDANFAATCVTPRSGSLQIGCAGSQVLAGGGYQVTTGALPGAYSVDTDTAAGSQWSVVVAGSSADATPIAITVIPVCLVAVAAAATTQVPIPTGAVPATTASTSIPIGFVVGGAAILLVILVLLTVLALRRRTPRLPATPGIEVVVRGQRSSYGPAGIQELR